MKSTQQEKIQSYYSKCLRSDLPSAIKCLQGHQSTRDKSLLLFARKVSARFVEKSEKPRIQADDPFVKSLVFAYRNYYRDALLSIKDLKKWDDEHEAKVRSIANDFGLKVRRSSSWDKVEKAISDELKRRGYFCLLGRVKPLRSLLVWKSQKTKSYNVKLIGGSQRLTVVFLDQFVELGWLHYATFGKYYVAGWAKKDALFCVSQAYKYKFDSDTFIASYLSHEAQHFADYKQFPKLEQTDLEYRAKLAELVALSRPNRRLEFFRSEAINDASMPHCFASYQIIKRLDDLTTSKTSISDKAARLLNDHTAALKKIGSKKAKSAFSGDERSAR